MPVTPTVYAVFGHFQNLNLLALLQDLRDGRTARQAWLAGSLLCPVAHGLPQGAEVQELRALGQATNLTEGCNFAARHLGADPGSVLRFVRSWDEAVLSTGGLLRQLEEMWAERLEDADAVQELLQVGSGIRDREDQEVGSRGMSLSTPKRSEAAARSSRTSHSS